MESVLEEVEFLARSENRVAVLTALADQRRTRRELEADTDASQATLGRILGDFQERSWVRKDGSEYIATATGKLVARGLTDLLEILETECELRGLVRYLPTHAMDFDLRHLADATITTPTQTRPNAPVKRLLELVGGASEVRAFSHAFNEQNLTVVERRASAGELSFAGVLSRSAIEALADDPELRSRLRSLLDAPDTEIHVREEGIPLAVTIADETVHMLLRDETGVLRASIDTDDEAVRSWASDTFDHYWRTATTLTPDDLAE
ncbi:Transcriptional regulator, contains HTH domain [Halapricum desulfuricans]|uniref:Transcriptional regulator, contains HTH domain n=1 Tax=Halapricum desulfuricans TaxID=2841257 RepID=A0A897NGF5_9EURY|nr:transcriptional regulator FilR1 domain-containing protein [Halapricum desulfuricans]QSG11421.1 Transcriptional regulator, contains HTH domain [Halapricum desulfuricans]